MRFVKSTHDNFILYDLYIDEFIYESTEIMLDLMTFLNSQSDQVRDIVYNTQDDNLHYLLKDVRNGAPDIIPPVSHQSNVQAVGLMYRIIDVKGFFDILSGHNFGRQSVTLKLNIKDDFFAENSGSVTVKLEKGFAVVSDGLSHDAEISMDISDFSSMVMGAVNFKTLYKYGLACISDETFIDTVNHAFALDQKPICTARF
jgi:predicted acetyltransferase